MKKRFKKFFILALIFLIPLFLISFSDRYFGERAGVYIKERAQMYSMQIINHAVLEVVGPSISMDDILIMEKDTTGKIISVLVNTQQVNQILGKVGKSVEGGVQAIEEGKISSLSIPLGVLISSTILADRGPEVKVKVRPIGSYKVDVISEVSGYGINNSLVLVYILVKIELEALIPLRIVPVVTESKVVLISQIIKGEIPKYYYAAGTYLPNPPPESDFGVIPNS